MTGLGKQSESQPESFRPTGSTGLTGFFCSVGVWSESFVGVWVWETASTEDETHRGRNPQRTSSCGDFVNRGRHSSWVSLLIPFHDSSQSPSLRICPSWCPLRSCLWVDTVSCRKLPALKPQDKALVVDVDSTLQLSPSLLSPPAPHNKQLFSVDRKQHTLRLSPSYTCCWKYSEDKELPGYSLHLD